MELHGSFAEAEENFFFEDAFEFWSFLFVFMGSLYGQVFENHALCVGGGEVQVFMIMHPLLHVPIYTTTQL
jgi:hypothetical protein